MSGIKIQINSLKALERLIGSDPEIEIELKGAIVQEFTKKHLKGIADEELVQNAEKLIKQYINDNFIKGTYSYSAGYKVDPKYAEIIESSVKSVFSIELNRSIRELVESDETVAEIKRRIINKVDLVATRIEEELSDIVLTKRIDELVNKKLKEKLNLI